MKLLYQCLDIRNITYKALQRIAKLTAFASAVGLGVVPLFAQNSDKEPAAKPSEEAKSPAPETSKGEAPTSTGPLQKLGKAEEIQKNFREQAEKVLSPDQVKKLGRNPQ